MQLALCETCASVYFKGFASIMGFAAFFFKLGKDEKFNDKFS